MKTLEFYLKHTKQNKECLEWLRCYTTDGYPRANIDGNANGKVHREVFKLSNPTLDITGKMVRHLCDNTKCINPKHLLLGSIQDNVKDMDNRKRRYKKLTQEKIDLIKIFLDLGFPQKDISIFCGVNTRRVSEIKCGRFKALKES